MSETKTVTVEDVLHTPLLELQQLVNRHPAAMAEMQVLEQISADDHSPMLSLDFPPFDAQRTLNTQVIVSSKAYQGILGVLREWHAAILLRTSLLTTAVHVVHTLFGDKPVPIDEMGQTLMEPALDPQLDTAKLEIARKMVDYATRDSVNELCLLYWTAPSNQPLTSLDPAGVSPGGVMAELIKQAQQMEVAMDKLLDQVEEETKQHEEQPQPLVPKMATMDTERVYQDMMKAWELAKEQNFEEAVTLMATNDDEIMKQQVAYEEAKMEAAKQMVEAASQVVEADRIQAAVPLPPTPRRRNVFIPVDNNH